MVKLHKIKWLKKLNDKKFGDITSERKSVADAYVRAGYAQYVKEPIKIKKIKVEPGDIFVTELQKCEFCDKEAHVFGKNTRGEDAYMCQECRRKYAPGVCRRVILIKGKAEVKNG